MNEKRRPDTRTPAVTRATHDGGSAAPRSRAAVKRSKRWAYGELSVTDIVGTASAMIRREGVEAMSMRRVADELGLSTMAMYYYVEGKRDLLALVVDDALTDVMVPPTDAGTWDERLRVLMRNARVELRKYPGLVTVLIDQRLLTPRSEQLREAAQDMLVDGGFADDPVALLHTITVFINQLFGTVAWSIGPWIPESTGEDPEQEARLNEELFDFGLDLLIDGLLARLAAGARPVREQRQATPLATVPRAAAER